MAFIPGSPKFNFVPAVEKKIVEIRTAEEITGEWLKHFCGPRDKPIFIRPISTGKMWNILRTKFVKR